MVGCCGTVRKYFTLGGCCSYEREIFLFESDGSLAFLEADATCLLILVLCSCRGPSQGQPSCCSKTDQDLGLLPVYHIVPHRMKHLVSVDVLSLQHDPSMDL